MTVRLQGPFPLDLANVETGLRAALDAVEAGARDGDAPGSRPGLYLLWSGEALAGLWVTLGPSWVVEAPADADEVPLVRALLDALTEAVWWARLPVGSTRRWDLAIVLEWPPALAERCGRATPGRFPARVDERREGWGEPEGDAGGWLDDPIEPAPAPDPAWGAPAAPLERRSVLTVVACSLSLRRGRHTGRFAIVTPAAAAEPGEWLGASASPAAPDAPLGEALPLPGGRVGHAQPGWLGRDLEALPRATGTLGAALPPREIGGRLLQELRGATLLTGGVLAAVVPVGLLVQLAATPALRAAARLPEPEAQPPMSPCSIDHPPFLDALRCALGDAAGDPLDGCDVGAPAPRDLQATWCGLADRADDALGRFDHARLAASQACYAVLGAPWSYRLDPEATGPGVADPDRFLTDPSLGIAGLREVVEALDAACVQAGARLEAGVEGAVLATLVGGAEGEARALRDAALGHAGRGRSAEERRCLAAGAESGVIGSLAYDGLCGGRDPDGAPAWEALAGAPGGKAGASLAARYVHARFGPVASAGAPGEAPTDLWACYGDLVAGRGAGATPVGWDEVLPRPARFGGGLVARQLQLEAGLRALADGGLDAGPCWRVAARALETWPMAHPLVAEVGDGWPAEDQQLCGQVCATAMGLRRPTGGPWLTPRADLAACVDARPPAGAAGPGVFDPLRLPWNGVPRVKPRVEDVCAFHLVAQGWIGAAAGPVLVDALPPPLWAGEATVGSGVAGGADGAAARSAESLGTYGRARSRATCAHVAAQCFASGAIDVVSDGKLEPWSWGDRWRRWVADLPSRRRDELAAASPWCARVVPYVGADGALPDGELDYPCAAGVAEVRAAFGAELDALARAGGAR